LSVSIRRAGAEDVDFLVEVTSHEDVEPYLAARRARTREEILVEIERSTADPQRFGRFIVEVDGDRAGVMGFRVENERSRIASLAGLAIHPDHRGRHLADEAARLLQRHLLFDLGYHRLQLEIYGFNERAIRHAERAGFTREGVRRKAYWRHDEWVDGVMYGLIREDLE
jgi:RimJ/RimL family protein N-acetyltransferase